ncbi:MAG: LysR family transcriptional regulator [Candidatus Protistobacter heckmanni]|nr:LysR family transcriptional regulator [Candidatus Protistobacter heckmanni]
MATAQTKVRRARAASPAGGPGPTPAATPAISDLRAFMAVADLRSYAAASKILHLSQPALSRRISKLEERLGVRLVDRTTRSVELTALGEHFLRRISNAIDDLDRSVLELRDSASLETGVVTIGCVFSAVHHFLPTVIRQYHALYPRIGVQIIEQGADGVLASVKQGGADFGLNYVGMQEPGLEFTPLLKERFVLVCRTDHPLAARRTVRWEELVELEHVRVSPASRNRIYIEQALEDLPPLPRPICEVRHVSTLIGLVEAGLGVAVVPHLAVPRHSALVVAIPLEQPRAVGTIGILQRKGRTLSPAATTFAQLLLDSVKKEQAAQQPRPKKR